MTETATAAVFLKNREPFDLRSYPVPEPKERDVVVRVTRANVCGSDLHIWRGDMDLRAMGVGYGIVLGHELVGRVAKLGASVRSDALGRPLREGDRIAFTYYASCGSCRACMRTLPHACMMSLASVVRSCDVPPHFTGGFAEYYYLGAKQRIFKIPDKVSDAAAAGANCALSQVIHGLDEARLRMGETVVVQGAGGLGLYACAVAKEMGAHRVIAIDAIAERLELARRFGADDVIDMSRVPDPKARVSQVMKLTDSWGADLVVEVAGVPEACNEGIRMTGRGGRYLVLGNISAKKTFEADPSLWTGHNRSIIGVSLYPPQVLARALDFLARTRERYPFDVLASHEYPLAKITDAFRDADPHKQERSKITRASIVFPEAAR
jgi:D-arabinose 1-dehydrogenase-like Zn-dependent alcohol dehydrogenase